MQIIISSQRFLFMVIILFGIAPLNPPTTSFFFFLLLIYFLKFLTLKKQSVIHSFCKPNRRDIFQMLPCISTFPGKTVLKKKIFRGVPSNQSPSAKGTCWWQICISLWFMVIKIWYSAGKSIESQGWMVICCNGTWKELFYFFFIVFLSICLTQVFINSLLTIKVPVLLKKKKQTNFPLPTLQEIFTYYLLVSQNVWAFVLCMAFSPLVWSGASVSMGTEAHLTLQTLEPPSMLRHSYYHVLTGLDFSQETEFCESPH